MTAVSLPSLSVRSTPAGVKLIHVPLVEPEMTIDVAAVRRLIGPNTILIYSSAPTYPHGAVDPVERLAELARRYDVGLHVDCCLGGFVLPFAKKLGYTDIPSTYKY